MPPATRSRPPRWGLPPFTDRWTGPFRRNGRSWTAPPLPAEAPDPALLRDPGVPLAAEVVATNPADGLQGLMVPAGGGA